jgi:hypothetical protein
LHRRQKTTRRRMYYSWAAAYRVYVTEKMANRHLLHLTQRQHGNMLRVWLQVARRSIRYRAFTIMVRNSIWLRPLLQAWRRSHCAMHSAYWKWIRCTTWSGWRAYNDRQRLCAMALHEWSTCATSERYCRRRSMCLVWSTWRRTTSAQAKVRMLRQWVDTNKLERCWKGWQKMQRVVDSLGVAAVCRTALFAPTRKTAALFSLWRQYVYLKKRSRQRQLLEWERCKILERHMAHTTRSKVATHFAYWKHLYVYTLSVVAATTKLKHSRLLRTYCGWIKGMLQARRKDWQHEEAVMMFRTRRFRAAFALWNKYFVVRVSKLKLLSRAAWTRGRWLLCTCLRGLIGYLKARRSRRWATSFNEWARRTQISRTALSVSVKRDAAIRMQCLSAWHRRSSVLWTMPISRYVASGRSPAAAWRRTQETFVTVMTTDNLSGTPGNVGEREWRQSSREDPSAAAGGTLGEIYSRRYHVGQNMLNAFCLWRRNARSRKNFAERMQWAKSAAHTMPGAKLVGRHDQVYVQQLCKMALVQSVHAIRRVLFGRRFFRSIRRFLRTQHARSDLVAAVVRCFRGAGGVRQRRIWLTWCNWARAEGCMRQMQSRALQLADDRRKSRALKRTYQAWRDISALEARDRAHTDRAVQKRLSSARRRVMVQLWCAWKRQCYLLAQVRHRNAIHLQTVVCTIMLAWKQWRHQMTRRRELSESMRIYHNCCLLAGHLFRWVVWTRSEGMSAGTLFTFASSLTAADSVDIASLGSFGSFEATSEEHPS